MRPEQAQPPALHALQISFYVDPSGRPPAQLLNDWPSLSDVAEAVAGAGLRVTVVQACRHPQLLCHRGIDYHFVAPSPRTAQLADNPDFVHLIQNLRPDVFHVHGLGFPADVYRLWQLAPATPILLQDHADRPPRFWRRRRWRRGLAVAAAVAFCARAQSVPFERARIVPAQLPIAEVPESSSHFTPADRAEARRRTGLTGEPALLWAGHLDRNKDPLTVLEGVRRALPMLPRLQLWCCYGSSPLLAQVQRKLQADARLRACVHLLGQVPHPEVQELMRAADFFVLGSHREGSGYALIEALACGLPTVVTDIPSFRALTGYGATGRLWRRGDPDSLCRALLALAHTSQAPLRAATRAHFQAEISFEAVGRKLAAAYRDSIQLAESANSARPAVGVRDAMSVRSSS